ncbi:MAG: hypothetical protein B6241_11615 [Spirochaetaceae bacterium 4572_59]|nr:MAG: hypothetical protein B6241_11615 [Spirochaetaceae bacterium 4572_59]
MVNKTRQTLLNTFQSSSSRLSGEELSRQFGISRVAIWKHIKALQEEGYPIESGHKGYRLNGERDNLPLFQRAGVHHERSRQETGTTERG